MKKFIVVLMLIFLVGCSQENSSRFPTYLENLFVEEWSTPGLALSDGSEYIPPSPNETTGKRWNVLDFGAKPGDSEFDNAEIFQKAIDAAEPGDEIFIPEGEYFLNSGKRSTPYFTHVLLKSQVNIIGEGMDKTILISNFDGRTNDRHNTTVFLANSQSEIVISDLTITANTDDSKLPDPNVSNMNTFVETSPVYGITVDNTKPTEAHGNVQIQRVLIEKFHRMGIRVRAVRDVRISECVIQKAMDLGTGGAGYAICIQGIGHDMDVTDSNFDTLYNIVENNEIKGPYLRHAVLIQYYAHNNLVTNNTITDIFLDAIDLHGEDEYSNEISYNTVINTRRGAGVGMGNTGATHDASGPYNYVHNNTIIGGNKGVNIILGTPKAMIISNTIKDIDAENGIGIFIQDGNETYIRDNVFERINGENAYGIQINYSYKALAPEEGIPDGIKVIDNTFTDVTKGFYIEAHTEDFEFSGNTFVSSGEYDYLNDAEKFVVPETSDLTIPKKGKAIYPTDDNFITNEARDTVQTQRNMKFKASYHEVPFNRMIYLKFNLSEAPTNKERVYLRMAAKTMDGLATINIHGTTEYNDWTESTITWNNARYNADQVAVVVNENNELTHVADFTFPEPVYEFIVYYVDVTDYILNLDSHLVTLILSDEEVRGMYCEIYSKDASFEEQKIALIYSNE